MKPYGFTLSDGKVTFTRWFGSNGSSNGIPEGKLHRVIVKSHYLVFHQASREHGLEFQELTEDDFKKLGNPIKKIFKKLFKKLFK